MGGFAEEAGRMFLSLVASRRSMRGATTSPATISRRVSTTAATRAWSSSGSTCSSARARSELEQGRWAEAAESAALALRLQRTSTTPQINALVVLGLIRARRGDPGPWALLDEALALAEPSGELPRLAPVAAARAEAAWLVGDRDGVAVGDRDRAAPRSGAERPPGDR